MGPLSLLLIIYGRKQKRTKWDSLLIILLLLTSVGMSLSACKRRPNNNPAPTPAPTETEQPPAGTITPEGPGLVGGDGANNPGGVVIEQPSATPCPPEGCPPTSTPTPTTTTKNWLPNLFQITHYAIVLENDTYFSPEKGNIPFWSNGENKYYRYTYDFIVGNNEKDKNWSVYVQGTGKAKDGRYIQTDLDPSHFPLVEPGSYEVNAVYQFINKPTPKCTSLPNNYLAEDETMAVSLDYFGREGYRCGDQYYIEGQKDKIYTITDTGTFTERFQFDIFAGEHNHDSFYSKYPHTGEFHRVARMQK